MSYPEHGLGQDVERRQGAVPHYLYDLKNPAVTAWVRLGRVFLKGQLPLTEMLRARALNLAQFDILSTLGAREGLAQQDLADVLLVTKGNVTYHLVRMEARGLVERQPEGRKNRLYLTRKGRCVLDETLPAHESLVKERFSGLSEAELRQLADLLSKVDRPLP